MRDCEKCKHRVMKDEVGKGTSPEHFWGCECWECEFEPTTKKDLAVDCISRAEAIKCLECDFDITGKENMKTVVNYINSAHNKIVNLPSVKQEPKKGQWDKDGSCPFCGYFQQWDDDNFCGHCGAKLNEVNQDFNQE